MIITLVLAISIGYLFFLHIWLILNGLTTIEYLEKIKGNSDKIEKNRMVKGRSYMENMRSVLGSNILVWFLPVDIDRSCQGYNE